MIKYHLLNYKETYKDFVKAIATIIILSNKTIKASLKPKHKSNVRVTTLARPILAPGIPR